MILMDRENSMAAGWSHVISDAATHAEQRTELDAFRVRVGAPPSALQRGSWIHLDIKAGPLRRALALPPDVVRIFEDSAELVEYLRERPDVPRGGPKFCSGPGCCP